MYSSGSVRQSQCGGVYPCKKQLAAEESVFFFNPALMHYSNLAKDAYIIPLIFLETNLQHVISSCESEILSGMEK